MFGRCREQAVPANTAEVNAQVVREVLHRLDRAFQASSTGHGRARLRALPAAGARGRYHSFTYQQIGEQGSAQLDNGFLVLAKIGRPAVRWSARSRAGPRW